METSSTSSVAHVQVACEGIGGEAKGKVREQLLSLVDPFLVEALQNPRHRLTGCAGPWAHCQAMPVCNSLAH